MEIKQRVFAPVKQCIYCGNKSSKLTKEHIIPLSLNGKFILPKSSCKECAAITSENERVIAKEMFKTIRQTANYQTRRPNERQEYVILKDKENNSFSVPNEFMWHTIPYIKFQKPGINLNGWSSSDGWGITTKGVLSEDMPQEKWNYYQEIGLKEPTFDGHKWFIENYALLMAKIAHSYAVANYGIGNFDPFLTFFIRGHKFLYADISLNIGKKDDLNPITSPSENYSIKFNLSYFLGSSEINEPPAPNYENQLQIGYHSTNIENIDYLLYVNVRLFAFTGSPSVIIYFGKTDKTRLVKCLQKYTSIIEKA